MQDSFAVGMQPWVVAYILRGVFMKALECLLFLTQSPPCGFYISNAEELLRRALRRFCAL
jgi:hypothetical protein